jgi:hypothetical protein
LGANALERFLKAFKKHSNALEKHSKRVTTFQKQGHAFHLGSTAWTPWRPTGMRIDVSGVVGVVRVALSTTTVFILLNFSRVK